MPMIETSLELGDHDMPLRVTYKQTAPGYKGDRMQPSEGAEYAITKIEAQWACHWRGTSGWLDVTYVRAIGHAVDDLYNNGGGPHGQGPLHDHMDADHAEWSQNQRDENDDRQTRHARENSE